MIITTQDGRKLNINRNHRLSTWANLNDRQNVLIIKVETEAVKVPYKTTQGAASFYWHRETVLKDVVGEYKTQTSRDKASELLNAAWETGATEFTVPQDTFAKSAWEQFEDFCEEHNLTLMAIDELGYTDEDEMRNRRTWQTTSDFERRNILVADPTGKYDIDAFGGAYSTSFKKWLALQNKKATA